MGCVTNEMIRKELMALRQETCPDVAEFAHRSGIHFANIKTFEAKEDASMSIKNIQKWVKACGLTLSQFFARLEARERGEKPTTNREHDKLHRQLQELLELENESSDWITGNIQTFHRAYVKRR